MARQKNLEPQIDPTERQLRLIQRISRYMARDAHLGDSLQQVVSAVVEFMECDSCLLYLRQDDGLVLCASNTPKPENIGRVRLAMGEGLTGWVARERRLLSVSREAYLDPRFKLFSDLPEDTYHAFLSAPMIGRNRVVGVLNVQHREPHAHTGGEMEMLTTAGELIAGIVALALIDPRQLSSAEVLDRVMAPAAARS